LDEDDLIEIYHLFAETGKKFEYTFDDYIVDEADFRTIKERGRFPKGIYVHNDVISLHIYGSSASLQAWSKISGPNGELFIAIDNLLQKQKTWWRPRNIGILAQICWTFAIVTVLLTTFRFEYPESVAILGYTLGGIAIALWIDFFVIFRRVRIRWARHQNWLPNPGQIISSVIAILIATTIVFAAGAYLSPHVRPYLDHLLSLTGENPH